MEALKQKLLDRMVEVEGPLDTACWLWTSGSMDKKGYRRVYWDGNMHLVHRVSWMIYKGPIPQGLNVLHRCDISGCFNPSHLFLGTIRDNNDDMIAKGRQGHGDGGRGWSRSITPEMGAKMATLREQGMSYEKIAILFKVVSKKTVICISRNSIGQLVPG
jgi:hypothetical protein